MSKEKLTLRKADWKPYLSLNVLSDLFLVETELDQSDGVVHVEIIAHLTTKDSQNNVV